MLNRYHRRALAAAFAAMAATCHAQVVVPDFSPTGIAGGSLSGYTLNQWNIAYSQTNTSSFVDGTITRDRHEALAPQDGGLAARSETGQTVGSKSASAAATVAATRLGTSSQALDPIDPNSTRSGGLGFSSILYSAFMTSAAPVTLDFRLTGSLDVTGRRSLVPEPSLAGVAMVAMGSPANATTESVAALFADAGIDPGAEGDAMLAQLLSWPTRSSRHLSAFGALADTGRINRTIDFSGSVTSDGTQLNCEGLVVHPLCGSYFYTFELVLFSGAQNGAIADISHTLSVQALRLAPGATLGFADGQAIPVLPTTPVPEPAGAALLALGLIAVAAARRRLQWRIL